MTKTPKPPPNSSVDIREFDPKVMDQTVDELVNQINKEMEAQGVRKDLQEAARNDPSTMRLLMFRALANAIRNLVQEAELSATDGLRPSERYSSQDKPRSRGRQKNESSST